MHQRSELEQFRTPAEMQTIRDTFTNNHAAYPSTEVLRRTGISKVMIEEYLPLLLLVQNIPRVRLASLTRESNPGPDAVLLFDDGSQATVQITSAGENKTTALQRELLRNGKVVFENQPTNRNPRTHEITQTGRVLVTRTGYTQAAIDEVLSAIERKTLTDRSDTNVLLIKMHRSEVTMTEEWREQLRVAVFARPDLRYESIYVVIDNTCFCVLAKRSNVRAMRDFHEKIPLLR
jgi:hypothetical protein